MTLLPRSHHVPLGPGRSDLAPPAPNSSFLADLPPEIATLIGQITDATLPKQGVCNLSWFLHSARGTFVLKVAQGEYRGAELWAEHAAMLDLQTGPVPVPRTLAFAKSGPISYQLREREGGEEARSVLKHGDRTAVLRGMGAMLGTIHRHTLPGYTWREWMDHTLRRAEANLHSQAVDPMDFPPGTRPAEVLAWLQENRPGTGALTLLHGDYRPKNLLVSGGRISAVIDWGFADFGDPYYDLAIGLSYCANDAERAAFLSAYGLTGGADMNRVWYFKQLGKFINV